MKDEDIDAVQFETSIGEMKKLDDKGAVPRGGAKHKVRKGQFCAFGDDLSQEVANKITQYMKKSLPPNLYSHWEC